MQKKEKNVYVIGKKGIKMKALLRQSVILIFFYFNTAQGTIITWKTRLNSNPLRGLKSYQGSMCKTDTCSLSICLSFNTRRIKIKKYVLLYLSFLQHKM
jgi:hypothetical protein